jgi:hypothetical protein
MEDASAIFRFDRFACGRSLQFRFAANGSRNSSVATKAETSTFAAIMSPKVAWRISACAALHRAARAFFQLQGLIFMTEIVHASSAEPPWRGSAAFRAAPVPRRGTKRRCASRATR